MHAISNATTALIGFVFIASRLLKAGRSLARRGGEAGEALGRKSELALRVIKYEELRRNGHIYDRKPQIAVAFFRLVFHCDLLPVSGTAEARASDHQ